MSSRLWSPLSGAITVASFAFSAACGGGPDQAPAATPAPSTPAPQTASASAAPAAVPGVIRILEPSEGSSSGHISLFRWAPVDGADGYRMRLNATADGRVIYESPVVTETEVHLPNTVAMEPEGHVWQVTALKGGAVIAQSVPTRFAVTP